MKYQVQVFVTEEKTIVVNSQTALDERAIEKLAKKRMGKEKGAVAIGRVLAESEIGLVHPRYCKSI